jgi:hypothetical protein
MMGRVVAMGLIGAGFLAGCGGQGSRQFDRGGFSAAERQAAQTALDALSQTAVATTAVQDVGVIGYPTRCVVHLERRKPLTFKLLLTWKAAPSSNRNWYSWVRAVIGPEGLKRDYSFRAGNDFTVRELQSHVGNAFSKPYEPCEITNIGTFSLIPFSLAGRAPTGRSMHG